MTRQEIQREVMNIFLREFEIENPGIDDDLRETYEFDSIDAIELLLAIENFLGYEITQEEKKMGIADSLLKKAREIFGDLKDAHIIDAYTPLTIRDYVNAPEGGCYGVMRSSRQLLKVASLNNIPLAGLYLAGQNALAPGVLGSIMGSFNIVRQITGAEKFVQEINWDV